MFDETRGGYREILRAKRRSAVLAAMAVAVLGLGLCAAPAVAAPQKVAWSKCFAKIGPFECGTVQVPLDYDALNGATVSIAVVRLPATDPSRRMGSLFLNPGGPGGSGVEYAVFAGQALYTPEVRARFDLVGFDPRGVARSTALRCFGTTRQWEPYFTPFAFPITPDEERVWIAADRYVNDACERRGGPIADHMSTANVARDLDVLRRAVGDDKLTYAGVSYGSYLGVTYANLFPSKVRALVVDGVLDPIAWSTGRGDEAARVPFSTRLHSDTGAQATLEEFFRLCDAAGPACAFSGDAAGRFAALAAAVKAQPVHVEFPDGFSLDVNYSILIGMTLGALYDSSFWAIFAADLADLESRVIPAALGARLQRFSARPAYLPKRGIPALPELPRDLPGGRVRGLRQSRFLRSVVDGRGRGRRVGLLRAHLDLGVEHLRGVAACGRRSLRRAVRPSHGEPRARGRESVRPRDTVRGCGDRRRPAPELGAVDRAWLGAHLTVHVAMRRRRDRALPRGGCAPRPRNRLPPGSRPVHRALIAASRFAESSIGRSARL